MPQEQIEFYKDGLQHFINDLSDEGLQRLYNLGREVWLSDREKRTQKGEIEE